MLPNVGVANVRGILFFMYQLFFSLGVPILCPFVHQWFEILFGQQHQAFQIPTVLSLAVKQAAEPLLLYITKRERSPMGKEAVAAAALLWGSF